MAYTQAILEIYPYSTPDQLKTVLRRYEQLTSLAEEGVMEAAAVLADLQYAMGNKVHRGRPLTPKQRKVIHYHLVLDIKQDEVARMLGVPQGVVSQYLKTALSKMVTILGEAVNKAGDEPIGQ